MQSEWREVNLSELTTKITKGTTPSKKDGGFSSLGINFIKAESVDYDGQIDISKFAYINEAVHDKFKRSQLAENDILFSMAGAFLGKTGLVQKEHLPANTNQALALIRPDCKQIDPKFLHFYLRQRSVQHFVNNSTSQSAQPNINLQEIGSLKIRLPGIGLQKRIAKILSSLDDKIQLNRQTNQTLEAMAQALFKSWFVDFDPVIDNALAAGHEIPPELQARAEARKSLQARAEQRKASLSGDRSEQESGDILPESIRQLFPNRFVLDAQMGWIPEGWKVAAVSTALSVNPRVTLPKGTVAKYVDMKALPTSGYSIGEVIEKSFSGGAKFELHDVLLARITPCLENGKTGFVDFLNKGEVGFGSTEFIVLRQKGHIHYAFVACLAREESFRQHCIQNMVGSSGRQRVQNSCFDSFYLALPSEPQILALFEEQVQPMFAKKSANKNETLELAKLRDTLLPKLISGELRLPDEQQPAKTVTT